MSRVQGGLKKATGHAGPWVPGRGSGFIRRPRGTARGVQVLGTSSTLQDAPTYLLPGPWAPILQVGKLRPSDRDVQKTTRIRLPARLRAPPCTRLHTPRCARLGTSAPRIQEEGWRGQAWLGAWRGTQGLRAHACADAHSGLCGLRSPARGPEAQSTLHRLAPHHPTMPHTMPGRPLFTARRPTPGGASLNSGPRLQPLISAYSSLFHPHLPGQAAPEPGQARGLPLPAAPSSRGARCSPAGVPASTAAPHSAWAPRI